jgi:hypothetical protein
MLVFAQAMKRPAVIDVKSDLFGGPPRKRCANIQELRHGGTTAGWCDKHGSLSATDKLRPIRRPPAIHNRSLRVDGGSKL